MFLETPSRPSQELPAAELYRNFNKKDHRYITGQPGCRASHKKCISIAKERNYTNVFILEDDAVILTHPDTLSLNWAILSRWDMLYFGGLVEPHF